RSHPRPRDPQADPPGSEPRARRSAVLASRFLGPHPARYAPPVAALRQPPRPVALPGAVHSDSLRHRGGLTIIDLRDLTLFEQIVVIALVQIGGLGSSPSPSSRPSHWASA